MKRRSFLAACAAVPSLAQTVRHPSIKITKGPPFDLKGGEETMAPIAGTCAGVAPADCKVLIYSRTNTWYVQPYAASPYTAVDPDHNWHADIHLGAEYAAFLVATSHSNAPAMLDRLPDIGGGILAVDRKARR
jgi:hypothetical protein